MKRLLVIASILFSVTAFQNCSQQFSNALKTAVVNGDPHQGIDVPVEPPPPSDDSDVDRAAGAKGPADTSFGVYALADETNGCGGATRSSVKIQAMVRITTAGLSWERHDCSPARGKSANGVAYFEARTYNAAVVQSRLLQGSDLKSSNVNRSGMYDVLCTNAPGDQAPPASQPIVEILVQKHADSLAAEAPGKAFVYGDKLNLKRKVHVRIMRNRMGPIGKYVITTAVENRPKPKLEITAGNPSKTTGNYIVLKGDQALFRSNTAATVSVRVGTEHFKNMGLRCYRNRNNLP